MLFSLSYINHEQLHCGLTGMVTPLLGAHALWATALVEHAQ